MGIFPQAGVAGQLVRRLVKVAESSGTAGPLHDSKRPGSRTSSGKHCHGVRGAAFARVALDHLCYFLTN